MDLNRRLAELLRQSVLRVCDVFGVDEVVVSPVKVDGDGQLSGQCGRKISLQSRVGIISFNGDKMDGFLALDCSDDFFKSSSIVDSTYQTADLRVLWKQELSNQILGALKVLLHPFGVTFSLGLPEEISATDKRLFAKADATRGFVVEFGTRGGTEVRIVVWLSTSLARGLDLSQKNSPAINESAIFINDDMTNFFFNEGDSHV